MLKVINQNHKLIITQAVKKNWLKVIQPNSCKD